MAKFKAFNLSNKMVQSLQRQGYIEASSVQEKVIPKALKGQSIIAQSETGSGKTHSFIIPIIEQIDIANANVQSVIIAPTRELARQIYEFVIKFKEFEGLKVRLFTSETEKSQNTEGLSCAPHIIVGTPGRTKDILLDSNLVRLDFVKTVVFDEADMLLDLGYFEDLDKIMQSLKEPQLMVFSATIEEKLKHVLYKYVKADVVITLENNRTAKQVKHILVDIKHNDRNETLDKFINIINPYFLIIFASKKQTVNEIYAFLKFKNYDVAILTGDLSLRERRSTLRRIKNNEFHIVVCSDLAARGLDFDDVSDVINIDLPNELEYYYHRAGRTGRFNKEGNCYTFYNSDTTKKIKLLMSQGLKFEFAVIKNDELVEGKPFVKEFKNKKMDDDLKKEIIKAKHFASCKEGVKPGYKRKIKTAVKNVKKKHRREIIKADIKKQREERYKEATKKRKENL